MIGTMQAVPNATIFPHSCVGCSGTNGPLVDTGRELHGYGRVYVCRSCLKWGAIEAGLLSAEDADALAEALERASTAERDIRVSEDRRIAAERRVEEQEGRILELEERATQQLGRIEQLEGAIAEKAQADLALVSRD